MPEQPSTGSRTNIEEAVLYLASVCDGAIERDGAGFNGVDSHYGKSLAQQLERGRSLSPLQAVAAGKLCGRYTRQLEAAGLSTDFGDTIHAAKREAERTDMEASSLVVTMERIASEDRIAVAVPYSLKDAFKALPGRRWEPESKRWHLPATPAGAETLGRFARDHRFALAGPPEFEALLEEARVAFRANKLREADDSDLPMLPTKLEGWSHQRQAFAFARARRSTMLAMDMGTGKTLTTIALLEEWDAKRVLIVCPKNAVGVWPHGFAYALSENWNVVRAANGGSAKRAEQVKLMARLTETRGDRFVYVVNYESTWRDGISDELLAVGWDVIVCDESHRIKSPGGKASRFMHRLGKRAKRKLCLTGTPMGHSPLDIYGQYRFLDEGVLGTSFARFRNRYAEMGGYEGREVVGFRPETADELAAKFASLAYQCKADDVLDLPEALEVTRVTHLEPAGARAYKQMEALFVAEAGKGAITAKNAGVKVLRLQQITSGRAPTDDPDAPAQVTVSTAKRELLRDVLLDMPEGEPVIVFAKFTADLAVISEVAAELQREYRELSGHRRDLLNEDARVVAGFQGIGGVQIQSGGAGIDLTAACKAIYFSVGHSLTDYEQSLKRLHRPGQERKVLYVHLVCEGTIDQTIYRALSERKSVIEAVLAAAKANTIGASSEQHAA